MENKMKKNLITAITLLAISAMSFAQDLTIDVRRNSLLCYRLDVTKSGSCFGSSYSGGKWVECKYYRKDIKFPHNDYPYTMKNMECILNIIYPQIICE